MPDKVLLGYEVPTGNPVEIPLNGHLCVTGQTQAAGKTTTLEALIARSGRRAVCFVTKRAEGSFADARRIPPYFRERADWQFVASLLEATFREKMRFERSWIMRASKGAHSLEDVDRNIQKALTTARGLSESVYYTLHEYLKLVIPQLRSLPPSPGVDLKPGVNVMDLSKYSGELQALVIRSVIEWIYEKERDTVVVIPEAWEFIPAQRGGPVKLACEELIRKGGASRNHVWLDSQDTASIARNVTRSISIWILGVQRDEHEIKRNLSYLTDRPRPKASEIMGLKRGEFFVSYGDEIRKVYVQPAWMLADEAQALAQGEKPYPHSRVPSEIAVREQAQREGRLAHDAPTIQEDANVDFKQAYEDSLNTIKRLEVQIEDLRRELHGQKPALEPQVPMSGQPIPVSPEYPQAIYAYVREQLLKDKPLLKLAMEVPEIQVEKVRVTVEAKHDTLKGRLAGMISTGFFTSPATGNSAYSELQRRSFPTAKPNVYRELDKLTELGFLTKEDGGYQAVAGMKVRIIES